MSGNALFKILTKTPFKPKHHLDTGNYGNNPKDRFGSKDLYHTKRGYSGKIEGETYIGHKTLGPYNHYHTTREA